MTGGNTGQHPLCSSSAQLRATPAEDGGGGGARSDRGGLGTARSKPKASSTSHLVLWVSTLLSRADHLGNLKTSLEAPVSAISGGAPRRS